jgi:hypothetical protein
LGGERLISAGEGHYVQFTVSNSALCTGYDQSLMRGEMVKMKKNVLWIIMAACSMAACSMAVVIYPANNGFELTNQVVAARITYVSQTNTVTSTGWTLYGGGANSQLVAVVANGWTGLVNNNLTNGNHDGTTSTYGQAMMFRGGDGKYGTNATLRSAYISTLFTFAEAMTNVTVQFDYRSRAANANQIKAYIVDTNNTVYDMGFRQSLTTNFVTFKSSGTNVQSLAAGTYALYLVGGVDNNAYTAIVDNVQINAAPTVNLKLFIIN